MKNKDIHLGRTRLANKLLINRLAKCPLSPVLHYACKSLLTENNGKNNAIAVGLCAVFVVSWW